VYLLIDALVNAMRDHGKTCLALSKDLFEPFSIPMELKIVTTCRSEDDIQAKSMQCSAFLDVYPMPIFRDSCGTNPGK
jgi:hypothetical protein